MVNRQTFFRAPKDRTLWKSSVVQVRKQHSTRKGLSEWFCLEMQFQTRTCAFIPFHRFIYVNCNVLELGVSLFLDWLQTKAWAFGLTCYLTYSWRKKIDIHSQDFSAKMKASEKGRHFNSARWLNIHVDIFYPTCTLLQNAIYVYLLSASVINQ